MLLDLHEAYEDTLMSQLKVASILCSWFTFLVGTFIIASKCQESLNVSFRNCQKDQKEKDLLQRTLGLSFNFCVAVTPHSM